MGDNVIDFPVESVWCNKCGKQLQLTGGSICVFTCTVNGHLGSMIYCRECLDLTIVEKDCTEGRHKWQDDDCESEFICVNCGKTEPRQ